MVADQIKMNRKKYLLLLEYCELRGFWLGPILCAARVAVILPCPK